MPRNLLGKQKYLFILILLFAGELAAQSIITDRPDQTESSSTVGLGNLQIESGFLIGFEGDEGHSVRQILAPTTLFRYGITDGIELRLVNQFESLKFQDETFRGISDLEIGTKFEIFKTKESGTEVAFLSHLIVPTGAKELTSDEFGTVNKLSISHELSDNIGLGYNIGYNYFGTGKGDLTYSIALGIGVNDKVGIYIEPYGDIVDFEEWIANADAGFTYLVNEQLQLDFSFGAGITQRMNYLSVGVSWLILKHK